MDIYTWGRRRTHIMALSFLSHFSRNGNASSPSLPQSISTGQRIEPILSNHPDSRIPNDIVEAPNESTEFSDFNISQLSLAMQSAHKRPNKRLLKKVRALVTKAARTQPNERTPGEMYLLNHWRTPAFQSRSSLSLPLPLNSHPSLQAVQSPSSAPFLEVFVDASPHGIGLVFKDRWLAWTFTPHHQDIPVGPDNNIIISWAELIAVELAIFALAGYRNNGILVRSDNKDVVNALTKKSWTPNYGLDVVLARILGLCEAAPLELKTEWISTKKNPADGPSRGDYPLDMILSHIPSIPRHLEGLVSQIGVA